MFLSTKIKSPIINVGIIEPEGILYGSMKKDLIRSTTNKTGKIDDENSDIREIIGLLILRRLNNPVNNVSTTSISVKSILFFRCR